MSTIYISDEQKAQLAIDHAQSQRTAARDAMIRKRSQIIAKSAPTTDAEVAEVKAATRAEYLARRYGRK